MLKWNEWTSYSLLVRLESAICRFLGSTKSFQEDGGGKHDFILIWSAVVVSLNQSDCSCRSRFGGGAWGCLTSFRWLKVGRNMISCFGYYCVPKGVTSWVDGSRGYYIWEGWRPPLYNNNPHEPESRILSLLNILLNRSRHSQNDTFPVQSWDKFKLLAINGEEIPQTTVISRQVFNNWGKNRQYLSLSNNHPTQNLQQTIR